MTQTQRLQTFGGKGRSGLESPGMDYFLQHHGEPRVNHPVFQMSGRTVPQLEDYGLPNAPYHPYHHDHQQKHHHYMEGPKTSYK